MAGPGYALLERVRPQAQAMIDAPPDHEIVLRTNQTRQLYGWAAACLVLVLLSVFCYVTKERPFSVVDCLTSAMALLFGWGTWRLAWMAFRGYPQLSILGSHLSFRWGTNSAKVLDLNVLGPAEVLVEKARGGTFYALAFRDRRDCEALDATGMMEPIHVDGAKQKIPLLGLTGKRSDLAEEIAEVINARRALALTPLTLSDGEIDAINAKFVRRRRWHGLGAIGALLLGLAIVTLLEMLS